MNYLAHIFLSGPEPEHQLGGFLGDFVKGPLKAEYPVKVEMGIRLHRRIDSQTDNHPSFRERLGELPSPWRRFGGILLDVYFDYLLASRWQTFHDRPLEEYCGSFYQQLNNYQWLLPAGALQFSYRAPEIKWLENYACRDMIPIMLNNLGKRLRRPVELGESWPEIIRLESALEETFYLLMESHQALATTFFRDKL